MVTPFYSRCLLSPWPFRLHKLLLQLSEDDFVDNLDMPIGLRMLNLQGSVLYVKLAQEPWSVAARVDK